MTTRPHLLITADRIEGLRHIDDVRRVAQTPLGQPSWDALIAKAEAAIDAEPITPWTSIAPRSEAERAIGNRDYQICNAAVGRICACAMAHLLTEKQAYFDAAMRQLACLFDAREWPDWIDKSHMGRGLFADLRHGQISRDLGLAYDWLHPAMSDAQRRGYRNGLKGRGMQPIYDGIANNNWWADGTNNWMTVIVGGLGVACMAMHDEDPDAPEWLKLTVPRIQGYLDHLGPEGEFNENPGYAGSMHVVTEFFTAWRYHTANRENLLGDQRLNTFGHWMAKMTLSQGKLVPFGDSPGGKAAYPSLLASLADAGQDPVLQWYFQQLTAHNERGHNRPEIDLLAINPDVPTQSPDDAGWPRSHSFPGQGKLVYSRTDWDFLAPRCVVFSKARHGWEIEDGPSQGFLHHDYDAGHLLIQAFGQPLIVEVFHQGYAKDFFLHETRPRYYCKGTLGHNVPMIGGRNTPMQYEPFTQLTHHEASDAGACWTMDLTPAYEGATKVQRTVAHLYPGVIAVLDAIALDKAEDISLRWHTADRCEPSADGAFTVASEGVKLASQMVRLDGDAMTTRRGEHKYEPPFDRHRNGSLFNQPHESYVEAVVHDDKAIVLSLFATFGPDEDVAAWVAGDDGKSWHIATAEGNVTVSLEGDKLTLQGPGGTIATA